MKPQNLAPGRPEAALVTSIGLTAASLLLPWAASGAVSRSGWDLATTAARLEIVESGFGRLLLAAFFFVPAGACAVFVAAVTHRFRILLATATLTAAVSAGGAVVVARSPFEVRWGLTLNVVLCLADVAVIALVSKRRMVKTWTTTK